MNGGNISQLPFIGIVLRRIIRRIKDTTLSFVFLLTFLLTFFLSSAQTTQTFTVSGTFTVPSGVTEIIAECWGAGGAGGGSTQNNRGGSGGGGGGYCTNSFTVTPGQSISYTVGSGGTGSTGNGTAGGATSILSLIANGGGGGGANRGVAGSGGSASGGSTNISGGTGTTGGNSGGDGGVGANGGAGGDGATNNNGGDGSTPGGGGGGGERSSSNRSGGNGASGLVKISYTTVPPACSTPILPVDEETNFAIDGTLSWNGSTGATGYYLYFGTDPGATNIENGTDLGNVTSYLPSADLDFLTAYYWQVIPYNSYGNASGCSIWSFTTSDITYCTSNGTTQYDDGITLVTFNTINNSTGKTSGYNDYTSINTDVGVGNSYDITVNLNTDGSYTNYAKAWIDWNIDGVFDASEEYDLGSITNSINGATSNSPLSITVPVSASIGLTRMRISTKYNGYPDACEGNFDGEVEDYSINILASCNTPDTPTLSTTTSSICSGESTTLSISSGNLNDADHWQWYSGSCGGTMVDQGSSISVSPETTTTYYARGEGNSCDGTNCGSITITVSPSISDFSATITDASCPETNDGAIIVESSFDPYLDFQNSDFDYVNINSDFLSNLSQFTLEGWIRVDKSTIGSRIGLFGQNDAVEFGFIDNSNLQCWTPDGGSVSVALSLYLDDNDWHHIAAVGDGTNIIIYIDGISAGSGGSSTSNYGTSSETVRIGAAVFDAISSTTSGFTGQIARVGFWNIAQNTSQISDLAAGFTVYDGDESGLIAGYNFSEGSGSSVSSLPSGYAGSLENTPEWDNVFSFSWTKTGDGSFSASTKNLSDLSSGEYNLTINNGSCSRTKSFTVSSVNNIPTIGSVGTPSALCEGDTYSPSNPSVTDNGSTITAQGWEIETMAGSGSYTGLTVPHSFSETDNGKNVRFYATNSCGTGYSNEVTLAINSLPTATITGNNSPVCEGESVVFDVVGTNGASLTYNLNGGTSETVTLNSGTTTIISGSAGGNQTLYLELVEDVSCSTIMSESSTVIVNPLPTVVANATSTILCEGEDVTLTGGGATSYIWDNGVIDGVAFSATATTTYTVTGTDANGCENTDQITISVNPLPAIPTASSNSPVCAGSDIQLSTATVSGATYSWTGPNGFISTNQNPTISGSWTGNSGTYSVTVTVDGCTSAAGSTDVVVDPTTQGGWIEPSNYNPVCEGSVIPLLTIRNSVGSVLRWERQLDGGSWEDMGNAGSTTYTETPESAGTWNYRAVVQSGDCAVAYSTSISVAVNETPTIALGTDPEVCQNTTTTSLSYSATTGSPGGWSLTFDATAISAGFSSPQTGSIDPVPGSISVNVPYSVSAGTYNAVLTVFTYYPSCISVDYPVTVTVNTSLPVSVSIAGNNTVCEGTIVTFTATPTNGGSTPSYQWKVNGSNVGTDDPSYSYTPVDGDKITCELTSSSLCTNGSTATSNEITMAVNSMPTTPVLSSNTPVCPGGNAVFTISGAPGDEIDYTGDTTGTATIETGGTIDITISNVSSDVTLNLTNVTNGICNSTLSGISETIIVGDITAPVPEVTTLSDITAECSVTNLTAPSATDNCTGSITGTHDVILPITAQGTTVVTWTYDDGNGNISTQTQNVIIDDITDPSFTCPSATTVVFDALCQITVPDLISGISDESDNCGTPTLSQSPVAGTVLASGAGTIHQVTITADDGNGNTFSCNVEVSGVAADPIDVRLEDLGNSCQSGETGSTTTLTWYLTKISGTDDWTFDYEIKEGTTIVASASSVSATGNAQVSVDVNNETGQSKTFTIIISNVKDACGSNETNTVNNNDSVTLYGVPDTSDINTN